MKEEGTYKIGVIIFTLLNLRDTSIFHQLISLLCDVINYSEQRRNYLILSNWDFFLKQKKKKKN